MMRSLRSSVVGLCALAALGVAGAGCNTYRYFDVQVTFDATATPPFSRASAFTVQACQVVVSGADHDTFLLTNGCPDMRVNGNPLSGGVFEFSTFADSGTLTFTLDAYQDDLRTEPCRIGHGELALPVTGTITTVGELKVKNTGMSCVTTGNTPADGGTVILD